ncbi:MAG: outer membrane protein assembly factor BamD [Candidatus Omnitrophota bacterium]
MIRKIVILLMMTVFFMATGPVFAYWVWTPESGKWENPKYAAKDTPEEQLSYAQEYYKKGNFKMALKEFKKLIKYYPLSKEAPTAQYYTGRIMEDMGIFYDAFKAYQKVIDLYPYTELVDDVIEREYKIGELFFLGQKINVLGPIKVPARDKAIEILKTVADNAPYGKYADPAMYKAGLTYKEIFDYDNAILMFKNLIDKYPNSELIDKARYQLAECSKLLSLKPEYDQTPTTVAREEFEEFIEKHPESEMTGDARKIIDKLKNREAENAYNIGQFYEARKAPESAAIYYTDIVQNYPGTEWAKEAQERLNEIQKK